ncbi:V-type ATP synthase subunit I [Treponema pedis]|uniref:V-type ATP synthase subunit I n=1 Tax=Treponema pedis TaxID=409322 RepID=UPI00040686AE|nr:V-type ATPase 116kDa subunit family protein [Treponema pedis]
MFKTKKMKLLELAVLVNDVNNVIEYLGKNANFQFYSETGNQGEENASNRFGEIFARLKTCLQILSLTATASAPEKAVFPSERDVTDAEKIFSDTDFFQKKEADLHENLKRITEAQSEAMAFANLKVPYKEIDNLTFLTLRIGKIDPKAAEELQFTIGNRALIIPLGEDKTRILAASSKKGRFALDSELKKFGFLPLDIPKDFKGIPDDIINGLKQKTEDIKKEMEILKKEKSEYAEQNKELILKLLYNFSLGAQILQIRQGLESTQTVFRIMGWISANDEKKLMEDIDNLTEGRTAIRLYAPQEIPSIKNGKEKVPVFYKHNKFVSSFERIIFSYGAPLYGTLDPTPIVAVFFTLLFGIMFGDLGQGFVFLLLGILMYFEKPKILKRVSKFAFVFMAIGIASMFMGFLTGEVFTNGHLLVPVSRFITGLFGTPRNHILHLMPEGGSIGKLIMFFAFTLSVGFIINSTGLIINIINNFRLKRIAKAVFSKTGVSGLLFFWYAVFMGLRIAFLKIGFAWFDIVFLVTPLLCIFFSEPLERFFLRERPVFENGFFAAFIEGLVEILEVFSTYISNSVSFLRVGAFALSHAVLSFIVFTMAGFCGGYLSYGIIPAVIGNFVIILLEGLIVAIQIIRLQYYEFFSKFFTETGREFVPFRFVFD